MDNEFAIIEGDTLSVLKTMDADSIDCVVTSPPFYSLRCYGDNDREIGRETSPLEYVDKLAEVFDEVRRVLKPTGTLWLNLGDTYNGTKNGNTEVKKNPALAAAQDGLHKKEWKGLPPKSLIGIPWRVAFALQDRGWILRNDIVWCLSGGTYIYVRTKKGDMPMMVRELVRGDPTTYKLWNGEKWTRIKNVIKNPHVGKKIGINLRSGERIYCTEEHRFPVIRNGTELLLNAGEIQEGDILKSCKIAEPDNCLVPSYFTEEIGWMIGLFIADGSYGSEENHVQFSLDTGRKSGFFDRLKRIADSFCEHAFCFEKGSNKNVHVTGRVFSAIIKRYVGGRCCYDKHLTNNAWMLSNQMLKSIMQGYLDGDGHYEIKNDRYRLGFCRNYYLERDFRVLASRLGASVVMKPAIGHKIENGVRKEYKNFRGEWRWSRSYHWNEKHREEVLSITKARSRDFYDIEVEDEPHLFALASGILTHNCKINSMPESAPDRISRSHEYIFMFSKNPTGYYFDNDSIMEDAVGANSASDGEPNTDALFEVAPDERKSYAEVPEEVKAHYKNLHADEKGQTNHSFHKSRAEGVKDAVYQKRRKRDVWNVPVRGFADAHFATFPEKLIEPCILAGCPKGGIVLDPFNGAATTGVVALKNRRRYLGIELYPKYIEISRRRIAKETAQQTFDF